MVTQTAPHQDESYVKQEGRAARDLSLITFSAEAAAVYLALR